MSSQLVFPIRAQLRTRSSVASLGRSSAPALLDAQRAVAANLEARAVLSAAGITYKANALDGLDPAAARQMLAVAEGLHQAATLRAGWKASIRKPAAQVAVPPADITYRLPSPLSAALFSLTEATQTQPIDAFGRQTCAGILNAAKLSASTAQSADAAAQQDWAEVTVLLEQLDNITLAHASADPAVWAQAQALAQQIKLLLQDMTAQTQRAATAAAQAAQFRVTPRGCDLTAIDAAIAQAQNAASDADAATNNLGFVLAAAIAQNFLAIPRPGGPAPGGPAITPACLTATFQTVAGVLYEIDVKLTEACTQTLLKQLGDLCGTPSLKTWLGTLSTIFNQAINLAAAGSAAAALAGAVAGPSGSLVVGVMTAAIASMAAECMLIQSVITEADDHHNGITMHFSSLPVVGGFAGLLSTGVLAPLFVPDVTQALALVEEGTLLAELAVPGGTGCSFFDMFWITGN